MTSFRAALVSSVLGFVATGALQAQQLSTETRDPTQKQDPTFAKSYREWLPNIRLGSPLVDHLPVVSGIPTPREVLGYHVGAPRKLTYYADLLRYYRALAAATPRVLVETIGRSDEGRELVVVWVSSEENIKAMARNRQNLARLADPRGRSEAEITTLINTTRPHYHLMGGLHSGETGPSEMLMELVYRLATETSPVVNQIRNNLYVSVTPVADADGRDRNVDWFYRNLETGLDKPAPAPSARDSIVRDSTARATGVAAAPIPSRNVPPVPYWGRYAYHDNNRDINLVLPQMRAIADWYFTAFPPIMHDLHESLPLLYTYSGAAPQNPNLDPLLFAELPWFANWEMAQMTKYGMPGVYTHAFMDGWSPGYLGSVSYNHNGLMKMYETQSGRDLDTAAAKPDTAARTPAQAGGGAGGPGAFGRGAILPTGRGGAQDREWYRGIAIGKDDTSKFTRRANANYMQTGVLASLQLASMFPATVLENFYIKTRNSIEEGKSKAPYGFVIPVQRDMTKAAELVNILRTQRIEIGQAIRSFKIDSVTYPAGSYVIKRDQPYGRLAKNLLEKQQFPDSRLTTYDDSGWTIGLAMMVDVVEVSDSSILKVPTTPVTTVTLKGKMSGTGTAGIAVAHTGSNNMVTFRYRLKNVSMRIAEKSFTAEGMEFPAGSFVIAGMASAAEVRRAAEELGLNGAALSSLPTVPSHDADLPRIAIYSQWTGTQSLGWYRMTFDKFGVPYDLIYKEQVEQGNLRGKYDVILAAEQNLGKQAVMAAPGARPVPYQKSDKYQFLGMYGETADMTGGFRQKGVDAFAGFLEGGGTLIAVGDAARLPIDFGWAGTVEKTTVAGLTSQRPLVQGEILRPEHPVFYGYAGKTIPIKYVGGQPFRVGVADEDNVLARYVGGNASVLSGLMVGGDSLRSRPFAVDVPRAYHGNGRVILFSNNPIYRWQNHGEFNMIFNSILNWNDVVTVMTAPPVPAPAGWNDADWRVLDAKVRWAASQRLDTLPVGPAIARLGETFVGTTYTPGTLEAPGPERVVVNLRELDCVTFIENMLAMTRFIREDGVSLLANRDAAERRYAGYLEEVRYRGGHLDGYASRLHYFSEWLADNAARGRLRLLARDLGGVEGAEPLSFMSAHPSAYRQMAEAGVPEAIGAMERRLNAGARRWYLPEDRIAGASGGIRDGDIIAATSTLPGLDVAHTGLALWRGGRLHLLHAPLVGKSVEISVLPLAERIVELKAQDGIMVARVVR